MIESFELSYPQQIIFGENSLFRLPEFVSNSAKLMFVTSSSFANSESSQKLRAILSGHEILDLKVFGKEAPLHEVERLILAGREFQPDAVIAIGGGSIIDSAKAAAGIMNTDGTCADFFTGKRKITSKGVFFIAIPTTAGSGAEITPNAVICDTERKIKQSIRHRFLTADMAIIDPLLTYSLPPSVTASSGMDALAQALESYVSSLANPVSKALAEKSVFMILNNILEAFRNGNSEEARNAMAAGSLLSAMSFSQGGLGAAHGIAHPIGSLLSLPHGMTCAVLLPHIIRWNMQTCQKDYGKIANYCGFHSAEELIEKIQLLNDSLSIPRSLGSFGLSPEHYEFIIRNCRSRSMQCNPVPMTDEDVMTILRKIS